MPADYNAVRYTRCNNNPSQVAVGAQLAALEGAEAALPLASGMAAISSTLLTLLGPGAHLLIVASPYGGTYDLVFDLLERWGVTATKVSPQDGPEEWAAALRPSTCLFYVEAISNPLCQVGLGGAGAAACARTGACMRPERARESCARCWHCTRRLLAAAGAF